MALTGRRGLWVSVMLLLAILAGLVRQWPARGLWYDETVNAYFAQRPWSDTWEWCTRIDNQMPLHFVLLKAWGEAVGTSEFALRLFSVLSALAAAAGVITLGRWVGGSWAAGWLAALVLALSQGFLYAAFEVRPYALALALLAWSSIFLWDLWTRYAIRSHPLDRKYSLLLAAYLLCALGMVYTHYTGFVALAAHGAYIVGYTLIRRSRRRVVILGHIGSGLALGYAPWVIALAGRDVRAGTAYEDHITPRLALKTYTDFFAYGQHTLSGNTFPYAAVIVGLVAVALGAWWLSRRNWGGVAFAGLMILVPLAGLVVMVYGVQAKLSGRHGWAVWLGAALLTGGGLAALVRWRWLRWPVWAAALLIVWLPARADLQPVYNSYLREAFAYIESHAEPGDVLVLRDGTLFTAAGYYHTPLPWAGLPPDKLTDVHRFLFFDEAIRHLQALIETHDARRVWVVSWQGHIMDPQDLTGGILEYIGDPLPLQGASGFGDAAVSLYRLHDSPRVLQTRVAALAPVVQTPPDGPVYLGGWVLSQDPVPAGGMVLIHTWWRRGAAVRPGMRVSVRLYDQDGSFHAQLDQPPVGPSFGQENWLANSPIFGRFVLWVPPDMSTGLAEVRLILYDMDGTFAPVDILVGSVKIGS